MKITFYSTMEGFPWGGSEELWFKVALLALQRNHQVQVCLHRWDTPHKNVVLLEKNKAEIVYRKRYNPALFSRIWVKGNKMIGRSLAHISKIKRFKPDFILVSQGATFDFFYHKLLGEYIAKNAVPYALISQFNFETGHHLEKNMVERVNQFSGWKKFYFVSHRNYLSAQRQFGGKLDNVKLIQNPLNIKDFEKVRWPEGKVLKMACVARFDSAIKGQDVLLEALGDEYFERFQFELNFYGSGPDESHLLSLISFYNLEGKAKICKHVSDIDAIWSEHHILVLPSIAEGTPLSMHECMFKGRPALTTDVGDCSRFVINGNTGFLAATCTKVYLMSALKELMNTPLNELKAMGDNAYLHVKNNVDLKAPETVLNDIMDVNKIV